MLRAPTLAFLLRRYEQHQQQPQQQQQIKMRAPKAIRQNSSKSKPIISMSRITSIQSSSAESVTFCTLVELEVLLLVVFWDVWFCGWIGLLIGLLTLLLTTTVAASSTVASAGALTLDEELVVFCAVGATS